MRKGIRAAILFAGFFIGTLTVASSAIAQEAPRVVVAEPGSYEVVGSITVDGRTYSAADLEGLLRGYLADPMNLSADLNMEVRRVIYSLAVQVYP